MKTLFISSNPPNEWRKHAHIVTWLRSQGYDIISRNIEDVISLDGNESIINVSVQNRMLLSQSIRKIISEFSMVMLLGCSQKYESLKDLHRGFTELLINECDAAGIKLYGVYLKSDPPTVGLTDYIEWHEWSIATMEFFEVEGMDYHTRPPPS